MYALFAANMQNLMPKLQIHDLEMRQGLMMTVQNPRKRCHGGGGGGGKNMLWGGGVCSKV